MPIQHSHITSPVYELITVVEFDIELDETFTIRVEVLRCVSDLQRFRAHVWGREFFRLQTTFPQDPATRQPAHEPSDEAILVDFTHYLTTSYDDFQASTPEAALQRVLDDFRGFLVHTTGQEE